jgi:hypothetical protein
MNLIRRRVLGHSTSLEIIEPAHPRADRLPPCSAGAKKHHCMSSTVVVQSRFNKYLSFPGFPSAALAGEQVKVKR